MCLQRGGGGGCRTREKAVRVIFSDGAGSWRTWVGEAPVPGREREEKSSTLTVLRSPCGALEGRLSEWRFIDAVVKKEPAAGPHRSSSLYMRNMRGKGGIPWLEITGLPSLYKKYAKIKKLA